MITAITSKRSASSAALAVLLALWCTPLYAHNGRVALAYPLAGIRIDGQVDDWPAHLPSYPVTITEFGDQPQGRNDFSAEFRVGYNPLENALYAVLEVWDDQIVVRSQFSGGNWNNQDGAELYLDIWDALDGRPDEAVNPAVIQYVRWGEDAGVYGSPSTMGQRRGGDVESAVRFAEGYRAYEWRVKVGYLGVKGYRLKPGKVLSFDITAIDMDTGSFGWMAWGPGRLKYWNNGTDPDRRGDLLLVGSANRLGMLQGHLTWTSDDTGVKYGRLRIQSLKEADLRLDLNADAAGQYQLALPAGLYRIEPELGQRSNQGRTVEIRSQGVHQVDFAFDPVSGSRKTAGPGSGVWQRFSIPEGLPFPVITALAEDRQGYLWLGSLEGKVIRYNGESFTSFSLINEPTPNVFAQQITDIVEDREGHIWFVLGNGTVRRYNGKTFTQVDFFGDNPSVVTAYADPEGMLWFGTVGDGVFRYDGKEISRLDMADGLPANAVRAAYMDRNGDVWFASGSAREGGVSRYDGRAFTHFTIDDGLPSSIVRSITEDADGHLWFATTDGVCRFDGQTFTTFTTQDGLINNQAIALKLDSEGSLWIGTEAGVSRYESGAFQTEQALTGQRVAAILEDREGNIWLGSSQGAWRSAWQQIRSYGLEDGLPGLHLVEGLEDRQGHLWFGLFKGGLVRYDGSAFIHYDRRDGLPDEKIFDMLESRDGTLWFTTEGSGVIAYDGERFIPYTTEDGLAYNAVLGMAQDRHGAIWFGTGDMDQGEGAGLSRFDGQRFETLRYGAYLNRESNSLLMYIEEDRRGNLWLLTSDGLIRYDGREFKYFNQITGLPENRYFVSAQEARDGSLWFGTWGGGVCRYDGQDFTTFTTADGLAHGQVGVIIQDNREHTWFGTWGGGISRYDGRVFQRLTRRDGLVHDTVWGLVQDRRGDIWISTEGGLNRYRARSTPPLLHMSITADRKYDQAEAVQISTAQEYLAFEFEGISFSTQAGQMAYRYRLDGYEDEWHITRDNRVEYTDLPRGDFTFQVEAVDHDLNYSSRSARVAVELHWPYRLYATVGGFGVAFVLIAWMGVRLVQRDQRLRQSNMALAGANQELRQKTEALDLSNQVLQLKTQQLEKANKEVLQANQAKSAFLANMSHEIRTPMNAVINFSALIQEGLYGKINEELEDAVREISTNGEHLLDLINDILDLSKIEAGAMELQLSECAPEVCIENAVSALEYTAQSKGLCLRRQVEPDLPPVVADERRITQHVLVNLIKNAIKFTAAGEIVVGAKRDGDGVLFSVRDSGVGIPLAEQERIFEAFHQVDASASRQAEGTGLGLAITRHFVEMHCGHIGVESEPGKGAYFYFHLPLVPPKAESGKE